uniref:c-type cytochrome biogenensis protein n=1 Tax=Rhodospora sordida TaxID=362230 RepID=UPI001FCDA0E9|nr:c-type cytochrome biogenensis protein [Rhodospora sordida]UNJ14998.1 c-type cytochrome biogenensis protein [Rhodospora sordida]
MTLTRKALNLLSNLKFAISLLLIIAIVSSLGTVIEQNKDIEFYIKTYPESLTFFNWKIILGLQLNHIFQAWWYFCLIFILASSLTACTLRTQYPVVKISRKYLFFTSLKQFAKKSSIKKIPRKSLTYLLKNLFFINYYIFQKKNTFYAHKGLMGKIAPIIIHFSLLFLLVGTATSALRGYISQEIIVTGEIFHVQNLSSFGRFSHLPQDIVGRVNDFWITYDQKNNIDQFFSDISILNSSYEEEKRQKIWVNHPLKYLDTTIYQTDWDLVGIRLLLDDKFSVQIPLKNLGISSNQAIWSGSLNDGSQTLLSFIVQDLQNKDNILIYDFNGDFIGKTQVESFFTFNRHKIQILDIIRATGLQIKQDPGLNLVYGGFFFLIVSVIVNNIPFNQIWLLRTKTSVYIEGNNNKAAGSNITFVKFLQDFYLEHNPEEVIS